MDRLSNYLADNNLDVENIENGSNIYNLFQTNIKELVKNAESSEINSTLNLYSAFLQFTFKCYPGRSEYVITILQDASSFCGKNESNLDEDSQLYISKFLSTPLSNIANVVILTSEYGNLYKYLKFKKRRDVAKQICKAISKGSLDMCDDKIIKEVLVFLNPVL